MDKKLLIIVVVLGAIVAFIGFFVILLDWIQGYMNGVSSRNSTISMIETAALLIYTYFGIRFFNRHFSSLR